MGHLGRARCSFGARQVTCGKGHVLPDSDHPIRVPATSAPTDESTTSSVPTTRRGAVPVHRTAPSPAYTLTGQESLRLSRTFLTACRPTRPATGPWDYPSNPPSGRFCRPWYQVARTHLLCRLVRSAIQQPGFDQPLRPTGMSRQTSRRTCYQRREILLRPVAHGGLPTARPTISRSLSSAAAWAFRGTSTGPTTAPTAS